MCGIDSQRVKAVIASKGKLGIHNYARCRVRYFADGAVLGKREFAERIFFTYRERFRANRESVRSLESLGSVNRACPHSGKPL